MSKKDKNIRKIRSKNYSMVIESAVPTRFYWNGDDFDGIAFGPFDDLTRHERQLCNFPLDAISAGMMARHIVDYMGKHHRDWFNKISSELDADELGIPSAVLDAFKKEDSE